MLGCENAVKFYWTSAVEYLLGQANTHMPDEHSEKTVRVLEEIRDLLKEGTENAKAVRQLLDHSAQRQAEVRKEAEAQRVTDRRRFLVSLAAVVVLAITFFVFILVTFMPRQ